MIVSVSALPLLSLAVNLQVVAQSPQTPKPVDGQAGKPVMIALPTDTSATALRADGEITIDGRDNEAAWQSAPPITQFQEWRPNEGKPARFKTEAKIIYDAANLYVFIRAFDPHPDSIKKLLERRDSFTASDMFWVFLDSYHDKRTGYEFAINPDFTGPTSGSLHQGLNALGPDVEAAVVMLGDMVRVSAETLAMLVAAARGTEAPLVVSRYGDVTAPPLLFRRALFDELLAWTGEGCGKVVVQRHRESAYYLDWPAERLADVDTPEDFQRLTSGV